MNKIRKYERGLAFTERSQDQSMCHIFKLYKLYGRNINRAIQLENISTLLPDNNLTKKFILFIGEYINNERDTYNYVENSILKFIDHQNCRYLAIVIN